jgi:hypothetical protein
MAGIELYHDSYVSAIWVVGSPAIEWMGILWRQRPTSPLTLTGRFRFIADGGIWDSTDGKQWMGATFDPEISEASAEATCHSMAVAIGETLSAKVVVARVHGGSGAFLQVLKEPPLDQWWARADGKPGETEEQLEARARAAEREGKKTRRC